MSLHDQRDLSIAEEAERWLQQLDSGDPQAHVACLQWLKHSPAHVREFMIAGRLREIQQTTDHLPSIDAAEFVARAKESRASHRVGYEPWQRISNDGIHRRSWRGTAMAATALLAIIATWTIFAPYRSSDTYTTAVGIQRQVLLEDRSRVSLNTQSEVSVRFTRRGRDIELRSGQALFTVEHDALRPFRVRVAAAVVQAIGTQFDVRLGDDGRVTVAVIDGAVDVSGGDAKGRRSESLRVEVGEGVSIEPDGTIGRKYPVSANSVVAWLRHQLQFDLAPLDEIAAEFNRYHGVPRLRIEGDARTKRLSGSFDARKPENLVEFLSKEGLRVERVGDEIVIH